MSEVALTIGGRAYKVACADGEEAHVTRLGAAVDAKLQSMPQLSPQDSQNLLFGALLLADELHDLRNVQTGAHDEAEQARGEAERLRAKIAELADQSNAFEALRRELADVRRGEAGLREELEAVKSAEAELQGRLVAFRQERDDLRSELERAQQAPAAAPPPAEPDLAPALERFAELLETCADKLEGKAAAS